MINRLLLASIAALVVGVTTASAQSVSLPATPLGQTTAYATLGYTWENRDTRSSPTVGSVTGRLGTRFGSYLGVEGEYSYGVESDTSGAHNTSVQNQFAGYGVAYLPLRPNFDLFARLGYGSQYLRLENVADASLLKGYAGGVNYGAGAQFFFLPKDGLRFDYTRYDPDYRHLATADTYAISYVHRF